MHTTTYDEEQLTELLYQAFETELGGDLVYGRALDAVQDGGLKQEWHRYLEETRQHQEILLEVFAELGLDPNVLTPGRSIVQQQSHALVKVIANAILAGDPVAAELVAAECVLLAETKDHLNWELIGYVAKYGKGPWTDCLGRAVEAVEPQEEQHLYHTKAWARELWIRSLGLPSALPPPEEVKQVETAIGAARAEKSRDEYVSAR